MAGATVEDGGRCVVVVVGGGGPAQLPDDGALFGAWSCLYVTAGASTRVVVTGRLRVSGWVRLSCASKQ